MTPFASVAMLEKLALLKIALCRAPVLSKAASRRTSEMIPPGLAAFRTSESNAFVDRIHLHQTHASHVHSYGKPAPGLRNRLPSEMRIIVCPNLRPVFVLWVRESAGIRSRGERETIGQTPVRESDKQRHAFRTDADTRGRSTELS